MLKLSGSVSFLSLMIAGICVSSAGYCNNSYYYPEQTSGYAYDRQQHWDERDQDIHERADRKGDWGYKQNWRYDREAFYAGETQGEAYDKEHADHVGAPGITPDYEYLQMRRYYEQQSGRTLPQQPVRYSQ